MYVRDTVNAVIRCLKSWEKNLTANLGQDNMTVRQATEKTARALGKKIRIKTAPRRKDQKYISFRTDNSFWKIFGFRPAYSFEDGIRKFASELK
jgi:nucleoside-diphosphate-sugar epimerase